MKALKRLGFGILCLVLFAVFLASGKWNFLVLLLGGLGIGYTYSGIGYWKDHGVHFTPAWMKNAEKTKKLTDGQKLKRAALEADSLGVRLAAIEKLREPSVLQELLLAKNAAPICSAVLKKVTDPGVLKEAARKAEVVSVRIAAIQKLDDQQTLSSIAREDPNADVKCAAIGRITEEDKLAELAPSLTTAPVSVTRAYLKGAVALAGKNPELLQRIAPQAETMIKNSHDDHSRNVGGNSSSWQRAPHVSSDCHDDNTTWTPGKNAWGEWGYVSGGSQVHTDSVALAEYKKVFKKGE